LIAALYVETDGVYYGLPDVDPWNEARDARLYDGPWPVVAHPPCASWSALAGMREAVYGKPRGQDGGTFAAALAAVRRFGGVLEQPARSKAWDRFDLPEPYAGDLWCPSLDGGWACEVDQARWGLKCHKWTWLYFYGGEPLTLEPICDGADALPGPASVGSDVRSRTPAAFRDALLELAASVGAVPA
jgi:hypothetical protein